MTLPADHVAALARLAAASDELDAALASGDDAEVAAADAAYESAARELELTRRRASAPASSA